MENEENIVRYTSAELAAMRARGESQTDLARVVAKTEAELEADIASDPDWADIPPNWYENAEMSYPPHKTALSIRLDCDVVEWFRSQGPGYQTRINAVLRTYVDHASKK
jgi:uncharacterized protein (DUF4415 family)